MHERDQPTGPEPIRPDVPPVVVLGGPSHTSLGVIRALGLAGFPPFMAGAAASFVSFSRWHCQLGRRREDDATPESLAALLHGLTVPRMVLLPCSDAWVAAVARLDPALSDRFPSSLLPLDSLNACLDKALFAQTMTNLGLPHARTVPVGANDDIRTLRNHGLREPFLKPRHSQAFHARFGVKGVTIRNLDEAASWIREAADAGLDLMFQEYIPGPATAHHFVDGFVDRTGAIRARMARRRVRTYPEPYGDSSCTVTIPLEQARPMVDALDQLLPALRYRGVFNAQFKFDERDGVYKLLDLNVRPWGSIALAVSCGVDVVRMAYLDALGRDIETVTDYPVGRHWVFQPRDQIACWRSLRQGPARPVDWLRAWAGAVHPIWSRDDPGPALAYAVSESARLIGQALRSTPSRHVATAAAQSTARRSRRRSAATHPRSASR